MEIQKIEGKIGSIGSYSESIDSTGKIKVMVGIEYSIMDALEELAKKTDTKLDDSFVAFIKEMIAKMEAK